MNVQSLPVVTVSANTAPVSSAEKLQFSLNRMNLRSFIESMKGRFVSVDYVKRNGLKRTLTGRLGVVRHLKGGHNLVEADSRPYLTMFDAELGEYRTVNLATVFGLRAIHRDYKVVG